MSARCPLSFASFAAFAAFAAFATSCVPSTEELNPRGAAGFTLEPSSATRGEPFSTADGFVVTVDTFVLLATVYSNPVVAEGEASTGSGGGDYFLFSGRRPDSLWVPGVSVGRAELRVNLEGLFLESGYEPELPVVSSEVEAFLPRFLRAAELQRYAGDFSSDEGSESYESTVGPSALLAFRAEGQGRAYRADVTLASASFLFAEAPIVSVAENSLVTLPLYVRAEALFARAACAPPFCSRLPEDEEDAGREAAAGPFLFGPFAAADEDDDGILTSAELSRVRDEQGALFVEELVRRLDGVLTSGP